MTHLARLAANLRLHAGQWFTRIQAICIAVTGLCLCLLVGECFAQGIAQSQTPRRGGTLDQFLRSQLSLQDEQFDKSTRISVARVRLGDSDTQQIFVYVTGRGWCGSGGCAALLLKADKKSFTVIDRFTLVRLPVRILPTKTKGWHDIATWLQGGGVLPGHWVLLRFDGKKYPNPSRGFKASATEVKSAVTLPLTEQGDPLFP